MRDPTKVGVRLVVAAAAVAIVWVAVSSLGRERSHILSSNGVSPVAFAVTLPAHRQVCDPGISIPAGADRVQMTIGTFGHEGVPVRLSVPGAGAGKTFMIRKEGVVRLGLPAGADGRPGLCVVNESGRKVALAGLGVAGGLKIHGRDSGGIVSFAFVDDRHRDWADAFDTVLDQIGYAKGVPFSGVVGVVVLLLLLAALFGALAAGWRFLRP